MWWIIGIAVIGFVIYNINKDYKDNVKQNITNYGGMEKKYELIISYIKSSGSVIQNITKDSVILVSKSMKWNLDYVGDNLELKVTGFMPLLGNFSKKWIYQNGYPQEKMIIEIENYFEWQMNELKKMAGNNPYEHINIE